MSDHQFLEMLLKCMIKFCNNFDLLSQIQVGFRREQSSSVHAIGRITDLITNKVEKKFTGQACILDMK